MDRDLADVLEKIGDEYRDKILNDSRIYMEIDIGKKAEAYGLFDIKDKYRDQFALVPLRQPERGMKVRIDGRTFVNYAQFESGVVVPYYVARDAGLPYKTFIPHDSMVCNFV